MCHETVAGANGRARMAPGMRPPGSGVLPASQKKIKKHLTNQSKHDILNTETRKGCGSDGQFNLTQGNRVMAGAVTQTSARALGVQQLRAERLFFA